jgi:NitT/TauT family transport system substrate-binding protein
MIPDKSVSEPGEGEAAPAAVEPKSMDRRALLKHGVIAGTALASLSSLLAACGGDDEAAATATTEAAPTEPAATGATEPAATGATEPAVTTQAVDFPPADTLDEFQWSFAIPQEDSENTMYFVNKLIFGPNEGIDLQINSGTTTTDFIKFVAEHRYNAAHPSVFVTALVRDQGLPVRVYFDNMNINIFGFAVQDASPIQSYQDFVGKKIAIAVPGWDAIWNPNLTAAGIDPKDVTYEVVGLGPARLQALTNGDVEIIVTWNGEFPIWNFESEAQGNGALRFFSGEEYFKTPANGWSAAEDRLEPDRDLLVRAARAQARAMYFTRENPTEAAKIFHHYFPEIHTRPGEAEAIAADYNATGFTPETEANGLGWNSEERWQTLLDSMFEDKLTKNHLKAADMYTNDMVAEINDFDVDEVIAFAQSYVFEPPS